MGRETYPVYKQHNTPEKGVYFKEISDELETLRDENIIEHLEGMIQSSQELVDALPGIKDYVIEQLQDLEKRATLDYSEDPRGLIDRNDTLAKIGLNPIFNGVQERVDDSVNEITDLIDEYFGDIHTELVLITKHLGLIVANITSEQGTIANINRSKQILSGAIEKLKFYKKAIGQDMDQLQKEEESWLESSIKKVISRSDDYKRVMNALGETKTNIEGKVFDVLREHVGEQENITGYIAMYEKIGELAN